MADDLLDRARGTYRLLHQDKVWIDRNGNVIQIDDMPPGYKGNVVSFLTRRASSLGSWYQLGEVLVCRMLGNVSDMVEDTLIEEEEREAERLRLDPVGWMLDTPLVKRLQREALEGARELVR